MSNPLAFVRDDQYVLTSEQRKIADVLGAGYISSEQYKVMTDASNKYKGEGTRALVRDLNVTAVASVYVPKEIRIGGELLPLCFDPRVQSKKKGYDASVGVLYVPQKKAYIFRKRSGIAVKLVVDVLGAMDLELRLPKDDSAWSWTLEAAQHGLRNYYYVSEAPLTASMGRLEAYFPRRGDKHVQVPTGLEVDMAMEACGLRPTIIGGKKSLLWNRNPEDRVDAVTTNRKAGLGLPLVGKLVDAKGDNLEVMKTFQAVVQYMQEGLGEALQRGGAIGVRNQLAKWKREQPYLLACYGKTKGDYYSVAKLEKAQARFYVAPSKVTQMISAVATQALERDAENMISMSRKGVKWGHSAQGIRLSGGGTDELMRVMEDQLGTFSFAYAHCGDDTLLIWEVDGRIYCASVDATSFDLTQRAEVTLPVDTALKQALDRYDVLAAEVWFFQNRERVLVLEEGITVETAEGGMSGSQLQSKRNDVLMDVKCQRVEKEFRRDKSNFATRERFDAVVNKVGKSMGFVVRVDDFVMGEEGEGLAELLSRTLIKFLGYGIHYSQGQYLPFIDLARSIRQLPYPGAIFVENKLRFDATEAVRIAQIVANWGVAPQRWEGVLEAARASALAAVNKALKTMDSEAVLLQGDAEFGIRIPGTLGGVKRYLERSPMEVWGRQEEATELQIESEDEESNEDEEVLARPERRVKVSLVARASSIPVATAGSLGKPIPPTVGTAIRAAARRQQANARMERAAARTLTSGLSRMDLRTMPARERRALERDLAYYEDAQFGSADDEDY